MTPPPPQPPSVGQALRQAYGALPDSDSPQLDAELLLAEILGLERPGLLARLGDVLGAADAERFAALVARRAAGEPVAYLLGRAWFHGLLFAVDPAVLIPRPETELLVDWGLGCLAERDPNQPAATVLDVGTGSGAVIVALAAAWRRRFPAAAARPQPHWQAVDISEAALAVARANARRLLPELDIAFERADLWPKAVAVQASTSVAPAPAIPTAKQTVTIAAESPAPAPAPATFDLILANLPYVGTTEAELLAKDVRDHEPHAALFAGADGLDCILRLISDLPERLAPGGAVGLEVGWKQAEEVAGLLAAGLPGAIVSIQQDWAGIERLVCARLGRDGMLADQAGSLG